MTHWTLYTDGASRGNPGVGGAGALILGPDGTEYPLKKYLGHVTNNQAEYAGLLLGLEKLAQMGAGEIEVKADSELMIRQLKGEYRVKNEGLKPLFLQAKAILAKFQKVKLTHVPREQNKRADKLSNEAIDDLG